MRLSEQAREAIRHTVLQDLGPQAELRLFGSRLDDQARGGDIDLHIRLPRELPNPVWAAALLAARLERRLDGRKVDVRLLTPSSPIQPIDDVALQQGQLL